MLIFTSYKCAVKKNVHPYSLPTNLYILLLPSLKDVFENEDTKKTGYLLIPG